MNWNGLKSSPLDKLCTKTFIFKCRYSVYQVLCDRLVQFEIFCFQPVSSFVVQEVLHYVKQRSGQGKEKVTLCVHPSAASWKVILKKTLVCHVFFTFFFYDCTIFILWLYWMDMYVSTQESIPWISRTYISASPSQVTVCSWCIVQLKFLCSAFRCHVVWKNALQYSWCFADKKVIKLIKTKISQAAPTSWVNQSKINQNLPSKKFFSTGEIVNGDFCHTVVCFMLNLVPN